MIKFRAWYDVGKNMYDFDELFTLNYLNDVDFYTLVKREYAHWIPMQYTGLTDKNGTEVYESDIVRVVGTEELGVTELDIDELCVVKWDDFNAEFYSDCINKRTTSLDIGVENSYLYDAFPLFQSDDEMMFEFEVVGNIHENPELLEVIT